MTRGQRLLAALGIITLTGYLVTATGIVGSVNQVTLVVIFAIGPVAIIGISRLLDSLVPELGAPNVRLARIFLATAFVLFTVMVVVQRMIVLQFRDMGAAAPDAATAHTLQVVRSGVNLVQLGLDVAFDVFYCVGLMLFAIAIARHPAFGGVVGALGVTCGAALLALNLIAFPYTPRDAGLVDLGPVTGLWWMLVIALQIRRARRGSRSLAVA